MVVFKAMEGTFSVLLAILFFSPLLSYSEGLSCSGGSVSVSQGGLSTCYSIYTQSSAVSFFDGSVQNDDNCHLFSDFNFSNVTRNWSSHYTNCATDTSLLSILVVPDGSGTFPKLSSTHCIKYNTTSSVTCSCRMNCLLHFYEMPHNLYIYLEGIDCNKTLYNTTIERIQYDRDLSYSSNFTVKKDSIPCKIDPVISSSSPLISSTSFASFTSNIMPSASVSSDPYISSSHFISPTPSSTPMTSPCPTASLTNNCSICAQSRIFSYTNASLSCQMPLIGTMEQVVDNLLNGCNTTFPTNDGSNVMLKTINHECEAYSSSCYYIASVAVSNGSSICILFNEAEWQSLYNCTGGDAIHQCSVNTSSSSSIGSSIAASTVSVSSSSSVMFSVSPAASIGPIPIFRELYFIAAVGLGGILLILLILLICVCCIVRSMRRRRSKQFSPSTAAVSDVVSPLYSTGQTKLTGPAVSSSVTAPTVLQVYGKPVIDYEKWKMIFARFIIKYDKITIMDTIGEGAFGLVQKGFLLKEGGEKVEVAIKSNKSASTAEQLEEFMSESEIMLDFDHPNVLKLLGVCFDTEDQLPVIVLPFMANGDLKSYLQTKRKLQSDLNDISVPILIRICLDICQGMEYLAQRKFVHRDLAARNCMVGRDLNVCVADFGLSRDIYSRDYYRLERRVRLPVKWLPPESLHDNMYNEKTDVWSFGVTCWEVFSLGKTPYPAIDNPDVLGYIEKGMRLAKPKLAPKEIYLLLSQCWDEDPDKRPLFSDLVKTITDIHTNWKEHTSILQRMMEEELLSCTQEELAMVNSAGDITASQASFARRILRNSRTSTSSFIQLKEPSGYILPSSSAQSNTLDSSDEYSHLSHNSAVVQPKSPHGVPPPGQYSFSSQPPDAQYDTADVFLEGSIHRPPSLENFGRTLDRRDEGPSPPLPVFEQLYDNPKDKIDRLDKMEMDVVKRPERSSITDVKDDKKRRQKRPRNSSKSSTAPLLCSTSSSTNMNADSPLETHYYFTLEKPTESPVFGEDTDNSDSERNRINGILKNSGSSKSPSPTMGQEVGGVGGVVSLNNRDTAFHKGIKDIPTHLMSGRGMISNNTSLMSNQVPLKQF